MLQSVTCHAGAVLERTVDQYKADMLGAPFPVVLVQSVKEQYCKSSGEVLQTIVPDMKGLLSVVAAARAVIPQKLSGAEIRFLRQAICMKAKDLAEALDMSAEHFSRVESANKPLGPQSEKLLRVLVLMRLTHEATVQCDTLKRLAKAIDLKIKPFWGANEGFVVMLSHKCVDHLPSEDHEEASGYWEEKEYRAA